MRARVISAAMPARVPRPPAGGPGTARHGLAREIARRGACSRSRAEAAVRAGRVRVEGRPVRDPQWPCLPQTAIELDGMPVLPAPPVYLALNKPRGVVTTARDERGRDALYALLADAALPWVAPVGRLDKASEGLLLLSNDSVWAAALTDPQRHVRKTYHVQVRGVPDAAALAALHAGVHDRGEHLAVASALLLRSGGRTAWLECVLIEGRNRHLRRLLAALGYEVRRLLRVAIGPLALGHLPRGAWRRLGDGEVAALARAAGLTANPGCVASSPAAVRKWPAAAPRARGRSPAGRGSRARC